MKAILPLVLMTALGAGCGASDDRAEQAMAATPVMSAPPPASEPPPDAGSNIAQILAASRAFSKMFCDITLEQLCAMMQFRADCDFDLSAADVCRDSRDGMFWKNSCGGITRRSGGGFGGGAEWYYAADGTLIGSHIWSDTGQYCDKLDAYVGKRCDKTNEPYYARRVVSARLARGRAERAFWGTAPRSAAQVCASPPMSARRRRASFARMQASLPRLGFALLLCSGGCAGSNFDVRSEPAWPRAQHHFSTFAVQRDGLMSRDGWQVLGPNMPAPFGAQHCDVAYSKSMFASAPELADAIGSYVRNNGVTDALLDRVAPAAEGDTILFVTLAGAARVAADGGPNTTGMASGRGGMGAGRGGGGRRGGGMGGGGMHPSSQESKDLGDGFQIDASFYSVHEHRSLAEIRMSYTGTRVDEAVREFNARLDREFPGARCSGWKWTAQIDPATIRQLPEP